MDKSFFKNKKVLVTGASGLIGINLCLFLASCDCSQIDINYLNPLDKRFSKILDNRFVHKVFDICDINGLSGLGDYDIVFYCSGYGQPKKFTQNGFKTFLLNTMPLYFLAGKVKNGGHFLFVSTSEVYVNSDTPNENSKIVINPSNPRNCYIMGKLSGEEYLRLENSKKRIICKSVRVCLTYGPGFKLDDKRVLNEFIIKGSTGEIRLVDDGSDTRTYLYIDDAIRMMVDILSKGKDYLYNVGGKNPTSIRNLATKIGKLTTAKVIIGERKNKLSGSPNAAWVDIGKYENEFGVTELVDLDKGLASTIEWLKGYA